MKNSKSKKVGRNEKCNCGSGKKYKKCCMNKGENTDSRWFSNHSVNDFDVYNLSLEQELYLIKQSKEKFINSLFDDSTIEKWNKIIDDKTWLELSKFGIHTQQEWEKFKNQLSLKEFVVLIKQQLESDGHKGFIQNLLLGVLCGQEIGIEVTTQQFLNHKVEVVDGVTILDFS